VESILLIVKDLKYRYDGITYEYNLELDRGEIASIMGGSGSGKSTLLDLISGFLKADFGRIIVDHKDITNLPIRDRDISILFQHDNLFEHLSVKENILIGLKKDKDISKILKELGLEGFEDKKASMLSGGEEQRVALARTLLRGDKILLLDEPFSALDETNRLKMLDLIKKITKEKNLYTIFITHNKEDADLISDKRYTMKDAKLIPSFLIKN